jgi:Flp pilus assembly protein TadB
MNILTVFENMTAFQLMSFASVFLLVGSVWLIVLMLIRAKSKASNDQIQDRLNQQFELGDKSDSRVLKLWHDGKVNSIRVHGKHSGANFLRVFDDMRQAFGWTMPVETFFLAFFGISVLTFTFAWALSKDALIASVATGILLMLLKGEAARRLKTRDAKFERQFSEALGLATRSLRAGHPLLSAFQLIVDEGEAPVRDTFAEIVQQQALGKSLEEAIIHTAENSNSSDLKLFAASTVIQLRSGGNVADMMDRLSEVIRDRIRLHNKVRVLTSQTQMSKRVLIVIPFVLFGFLYVSNPEYIAPLFDTEVGNKILIAAAVMLALGNWTMNKIAILRY